MLSEHASRTASIAGFGLSLESKAKALELLSRPTAGVPLLETQLIILVWSLATASKGIRWNVKAHLLMNKPNGLLG